MSPYQSIVTKPLFHSLKGLLMVLILALVMPVPSDAQYGAAPNFSVSPNTISLGGCYTISVPNWPGAQLNVGYTTSWTGQQFIYGWPSLNYSGSAVICTDSLTHLGTYTYNYASNTYYYQWWLVNASITVNNASPQEPTSLTISPSSGYAGNDCYTMTAGNGSSMTIDLNYTLNGANQPAWSKTLNAAGQWPYCLSHYDQTGNYIFYQMKNHLLSNWIAISPSASYLVKPPQPTSFQITPNSIIQGNSYRITAGNGAGVTMDIQYAFNDGAVQTIFGWPTLASDGSSSGYVDIATGVSTTPGKYVFKASRNALNTQWTPVTASVLVCPNAAPTISSIVPSTVAQGSSVNIVITGVNLCAASIQSVTNSSLSFSNVAANASFTSVNATATTSNSAPIGQAQIRLTTPAGNVTSQFLVTGPAVLTKEYIYLGDRVIATVSP